MPTNAAVRSETPALPGPTRRSCARRLRRWTRPVRTRWKTCPARSSAESPRQIARGGDHLEKGGGGGSGDAAEARRRIIAAGGGRGEGEAGHGQAAARMVEAEEEVRLVVRAVAGAGTG
ncbi:Os04g0553050 [Oryza sativa Japonica Group]|uniref:Os04g0553050 protein n=1 Tax=Oryza sativa subsp. japonica TaxID=39947 RepID=A0A0P0WD62_ORYSJ|nr:Os04g0553050 [Oryza sativa Japonica Group]